MTTTYSYTGSEQTHDVSNLDRISTTLWGAGGEDGNDSAQGTGGAGGLGGYAEAEIDVSAISTLHIYVAGGNGNIWGYNDGEDATSASNDGGNGAGETSIRDGENGVPFTTVKRQIRRTLLGSRSYPETDVPYTEYHTLLVTNEDPQSNEYRDFYRWEADVVFQGHEELP
jgi:hypothetical protein